MNYIKEINAFYDWLETNSVSDSSVNLWHALMAVNNKCGWKVEFPVAISTLCGKTSLSKSSIIRARNLLKQLGRIDFRERKGNQSCTYKLIAFHTDTQSATQSGTQTDTQSGTQTDTILKLNKEYKYSFVKVSDFEESLNSFTLNKSYFYIAYRFWELWFKDNETKTLKDAMIINWYDAVRLIIETDKQKIDRLISVYEYFKKCQMQEPGFKTFWFETVKTIASFRKKDKEGVYYLDKIMEDVNKKIQTDSAFSQLVFSQIEKFKNYERSKLLTKQN